MTFLSRFRYTLSLLVIFGVIFIAIFYRLAVANDECGDEGGTLAQTPTGWECVERVP